MKKPVLMEMVRRAVIVLLLAGVFVRPAAAVEEDAESEFYVNLSEAQAKYRARRAEEIRKADRVVVYLVDFDGMKKDDLFADAEKTIKVTPYQSMTGILTSKEVPAERRKELLGALADQIAVPGHYGGAMCHFPIHGVRVYQGEKVLHEGTFCWMCRNFSFTYPEGAGWLDVNDELERIFREILPVPKEELERFYKKYPGARPKGDGEGAAGGQQKKKEE